MLDAVQRHLRSQSEDIQMPKSVVIPKGSAPPLAPYSPGTRSGNAVYVSGMVALDPAGKLVGPGDVRAQTKAVLESIKSVLDAGGGSLADITFNAIFLKDLADYKTMNEVYAEYFPKEPPARYCIQAVLVRPEFLVEVSSIAHVDAQG
jgi:aminoacrylate peracid reductase